MELESFLAYPEIHWHLYSPFGSEMHVVLLSCSQGFDTMHESSYIFIVVGVEVSFSVVGVVVGVGVVGVVKVMRPVGLVGVSVVVGRVVVGVVVSLYS